MYAKLGRNPESIQNFGLSLMIKEYTWNSDSLLNDGYI